MTELMALITELEAAAYIRGAAAATLGENLDDAIRRHSEAWRQVYQYERRHGRAECFCDSLLPVDKSDV